MNTAPILTRVQPAASRRRGQPGNGSAQWYQMAASTREKLAKVTIIQPTYVQKEAHIPSRNVKLR